MLDSTSTDSQHDPLAMWSTTITVGADKRETDWTTRQTFTWPALSDFLTTHVPVRKDGRCFCPATFRGSRRLQVDADQIGLAVLDVESGQTIDDAKAACGQRDYA